MQFDLTSGTDAGLHIIFDPASVMHRISAPYDEWYGDIDEDSGEANVITYRNGGDGTARFRVFVDEHPDAELACRAQGKRVGHLKVPSGRLFAAGMEYLDSRGKPPATPAEFELRSPGMGSSKQIAPGDYDVEAYDVEPESEKVERELKAAFEGARRDHPAGYRLSIAHRLLGLGGLLHIGTFIALAILAIFFFGDRYAAKLLLFESNWGLVYRVLGILWLLRIGVGLLPQLRRFYRAYDVEAEKHPLTVVVLSRRSSPPAEWLGVSFGDIDLPPAARPRYTTS